MKTGERTGLKTIASMLTIFVGFVIVCAAAILLLVGIGVMNVDWMREADDDDQWQSAVIAAEDGVFGSYREIGFDKNDFASVLDVLPFGDGYFIQCFAAYFDRSGDEIADVNVTVEAYDIYKSGDKYKIITYDSRLNITGEVICDGENVYVSDAVGGTVDTYPLTEAHSFDAMSPMPDFSALKTGKYEITDFSLSAAGDEYIIKCYMSDTNMTDDIHVDFDTGVISHFVSTVDGVTVYDYSIGEYVGNYAFPSNEFIIPISK